LIGFVNPQACAYQFAVISRDGIATIQGKAVEKE
jgi:hypothetical protein